MQSSCCSELLLGDASLSTTGAAVTAVQSIANQGILSTINVL
jgi:hypothetical protein